MKNKQLSKKQYSNLQKRYRNILTRGKKELPPIPEVKKGKRGKVAKSDAHNLWERFNKYETEVLLFAKSSFVPFTNNRAERDLRMSKVKQKVSGCFRSLIVKLTVLTVATTPSMFPDSSVHLAIRPALYCQNVYLHEDGICGTSNRSIALVLVLVGKSLTATAKKVIPSRHTISRWLRRLKERFRPHKDVLTRHFIDQSFMTALLLIYVIIVNG